jgi:GT2 family glycosyltransferase/glycosyltransferase involved in cell wall biosynthesis
MDNRLYLRHLRRLTRSLPRRAYLTVKYRGVSELGRRIQGAPSRFKRRSVLAAAGGRGADLGAAAVTWYQANGRPVAVVIPSYGPAELARAAAQSVRRTTDASRVRIIVSDDGSGPEHLPGLQAMAAELDVELVLGDEQRGFAANCNRGIRARRPDEDVVLLNSDIVAYAGWLEALQHAAYQASFDVVGGRLIYPDGSIQFGGLIRNPDHPEWFDHRFRFRPIDYGPAGVRSPSLAATGACMYVKGTTLDTVGELDEDYPMAFEDIDYALRVWNSGGRVGYEPLATLVHHESKTRGLSQGDRERRSQERFWTLWGSWFDGRDTRARPLALRDADEAERQAEEQDHDTTVLTVEAGASEDAVAAATAAAVEALEAETTASGVGAIPTTTDETSAPAASAPAARAAAHVSAPGADTPAADGAEDGGDGLRIIYVTQDTGIGGGHRVIFTHLNGLRERGHDVELWTLADAGPDWFDLACPVRCFKDYPTLARTLAPIHAIKVATWWETAPWVWEASVAHGVPVYLVQDIETSYYRDPIDHAPVIDTYRHEFEVLAGSEWVATALRDFGLRHVTTFTPGLDLGMYHRLPGVERSDDAILSVARSAPLKGFDLTRGAYAELGDARPPLWLFGIEPKLAEGMGPKVQYFEYPSDEEVNELYNRAAILLQTSRHEGFCLPALEGMAGGAAVVCTDANGNRDFCRDGWNCLIPKSDARSIAAALRAVEENPDLRRRLAENGQQTADSYAWPKRLDALDAFYRDLAEQRGTGRMRRPGRRVYTGGW